MAEKEDQNQAMATHFFNKPKFHVTLKFDKVVYSIKSKNSEERLILKGITGKAEAGEMVAMLGPSGSGKTTLLTALGGRLGGALSGKITYNENPFSKGIKRSTGFVTQDDILHPHLTVLETLTYTALLRLPPSLSKQEKSQHAESVMTQLGLSKCRNSVIGGSHLRGVSGGERKRVSIGQEMLINPSLLFLDEPTSGLDSTTAWKIVSTLSELGDGGRTIVMTIHQPASRLFYMFDKILLLSDGSPLYFGEGSSALDYFSTLGFAPSLAMNPADFLLDLANGVSTGDRNEDEQGIKETLVLAYETHYLRSNYVVDDDRTQTQTRGVDVDTQWCNSWWEEFRVLFRRGVKERKHESLSFLKITEVLTMAIMSGLLWWQSHVQDQVGLFFFYSVFWGFYPLLEAIFTFPQERMILSKERSSGMYRLSSYFMALTLADLPMDLILPTIFYTITYWMAGLKASAQSFFSGLFVLLYSILCTQGLGLAVGATLMEQKSAITFGSIIMLISLLASGFYVQHVPPFISWIKYLSIPRYMLKLLLVSQYTSGETYVCDTNTSHVCLVEDLPLIKNVGLHGHAIALVVMGVMLVGYRFIAYMALTKVGY